MKHDQATPPPSRLSAPSSLRPVVVYAVFAALWILFSDQLVATLFQDPAMLTLVSTLKGWLFVAVTSLLLYGLIWDVR